MRSVRGMSAEGRAGEGVKLVGDTRSSTPRGRVHT